MAPNSTDANGVLFESDAATPDLALSNAPIKQADNYPRKYVWRNIIAFTYLHIAAIYGGYLFLFSAKWQTDIFGMYKVYLSGNTTELIMTSNLVDFVIFDKAYGHYKKKKLFYIIG